MPEDVKNTNENVIKDQFKNVLNLPENVSKMDALRAYAIYKATVDHAIKTENLTEVEIAHEEALLKAAREQCLAILTEGGDDITGCGCCGSHCNEDDCCEDDCCEEGCCGDNCCEEGCCGDDCCEDDCCEEGCCGGNCCESDDCCEEGCCGDNCCEEECCEEEEHCSESCGCGSENAYHSQNIENGHFSANCCLGRSQANELSNSIGTVSDFEKADIGMCPIESAEEKSKPSNFIQGNSQTLENSKIIEEVQEKRTGFCGFKWFCF